MLATVDAHDLDEGPRTARSGTERMCAVTRQVRPIAELLRFVVGPDGTVLVDAKRKLPGRGLWVSASRQTLGEAVRKGAFPRGFRREVRVPADLVAATDGILTAAVADALAMAGKARQVVAGFTKVETALRRGEAVAVLHAADASPDGVRKLDAIVRQTAGTEGGCPVFALLTSAQLDLALGRSNVIHAALRAGPAADTVLARCQGLIRFRDGAVGEGPAGKAGVDAHTATTGPSEAPSAGVPGDEISETGASRHRDV